MKKALVLLLVCALLAAAAVCAHAENEPVFYIEAPESAGVGDTVSIRVSVTGDYTASILNMQMYYDGASFRYIDHTRGPVLDSVVMNGMTVCEHSEDKHMIATGIMVTGNEGMSAQGVIFEATFEVLSTASKTADFTLTVTEFDYMPIGQSVGTPISCKTEDATVSISGTGTGAVITPAPTTAPFFPGVTEPVHTQQAGETDPAATEAAATETDATEAADVTAAPAGVTEAPSSDDGGSKSADDKDDNGSGTAKTGLGTLEKVLIGAGACVLAAALAWLGVFFLKRGRAASREANEMKEKNGGNE